MDINEYPAGNIAGDIAGHLDGAAHEGEGFEHYETWLEADSMMVSPSGATYFKISARDGSGQCRFFQVTVIEVNR